MAPEALFQPGLLDIEAPGVAAQTFAAINSADVDLRKELYRSIVLSGGSTMFPGFPTRLGKELEMTYRQKVLKLTGEEASKTRTSGVTIHIEDPPRRKFFVFSGGSVLAGVAKDDTTFWMTKQQYDEKGIDALIQ